ncbi:MAG TPA: carbon-nitrogen hydrolase family protein [Thermoplasmata archaeon]|nr:carbon-nitrogen hydrolase family protein [Thermoplasmata archaeon]
MTRVLLAQLAPARGRPEANLAKMERALARARVDLAVFPELFLTGYRVGDRTHRLALRPESPTARALTDLARSSGAHLLVGGPVEGPRAGETSNAAIWVPPSGAIAWQTKRYLPSFGPFEEAHFFTPTDRSRAMELGRHRVGTAICYDTFFAEIFRELAADGAELMAIISASPVTSRRLFDKLLPARAVENGCPVLYVNRVGVEDGIVFGGGTGVWDVRGEQIPTESTGFAADEPEESVTVAEVDLDEPRRWRPFRPVLRDRATRPPAAGAAAPRDSGPMES